MKLDSTTPKLLTVMWGMHAGRYGRWRLYEDGTLIPDVSGGDGSGSGEGGSGSGSGEGGSGGTGTGSGGTAGGGSGTGNIDDLVAFGTREKAQGERAGKRKLLEQLGLDPDKVKPEDVKAILDAHAERTRAEQGEVEAAKGEAATEKAKREQAEARAAAAERQRDVERAILLAGFPVAKPDADKAERERVARNLARAVRAVEGELDTDADDAAITAAVDTIKGDLPGLFDATTGAAGGGGAGGGAGGGGGGAGGTSTESGSGGTPPPRPGGGGGDDPLEAGRKAAAAAYAPPAPAGASTS